MSDTYTGPQDMITQEVGGANNMEIGKKQGSDSLQSPSKSKKTAQQLAPERVAPPVRRLFVDDTLKRDDAVFLYRLRSFIAVNSPDTLKFALNDINEKSDETGRQRYLAILADASSGKESRARALKALESEIAKIGIPYESLFDTEQYR